MSHVYIIPADPEKETRNPNRIDQVLPVKGQLVGNTRQVYRARNSGDILLVPFHTTEGYPLFDKENPSHFAAIEAYEISQLDGAIEKSQKTVEDLKSKIEAAEELVIEATASLEQLKEELEIAEKNHAQILENPEVALPKLGDSESPEPNENENENDEGKTAEETARESVDLSLDQLIAAAIDKLEDGNEDHWTKDGKPEVKAINELLNADKAEDQEEIKITAAHRDGIWAFLVNCENVVIAAIEAIDHENEELWTEDAIPTAEAVQAVLGEPEECGITVSQEGINYTWQKYFAEEE